MFTGIITATGRVKEIKKEKSFILTIETDEDFAKEAQLGSSILTDGVCLTVAKKEGNELIFELMPETVRLTIADGYTIGTVVNLEPSLKVNSELGGHFVAGHVDGIGEVTNIKQEGESIVITFQPPKELLKYLAHKGSVAINGVSLTLINPELNADAFSVSLVTYTLEHTNLSDLEVGSKVNIEVDMLARYIERLKIEN